MRNHNLRRVFGLVGIGWFVAICMGGLTLLGNYLDKVINSSPHFDYHRISTGSDNCWIGTYVGLKSLVLENKEN
ncbi:MAG: hypothetical protein CM1200mP38_5600 [Dehalococcoidia bacterium]|nr:MAG: hypothetical protein CM1200mP38_5600 [Dehalococcoidia bacterium]